MANKHLKPIIAGMMLCAVLLTGIAFWYFSSTKKAPKVLYTVQKGTISEEVKSTGAVKAAKSVDLSFEKSGRIIYAGVEVGDEVGAGKVLASLDSSDISAGLDQANANVAAQEAKLNELLHGARPEQIQIQETSIAAAESSLNQARKAVIAQINNAYVSGDGAIHSNSDALFNNPRSANPTLAIAMSDSSLKPALEFSRLSIEGTLNSWSKSLILLNGSDTAGTSFELGNYISEAENNLASIQAFLAKLAIAVNSLTPDSNKSQSV
ncbi:MAG: hypothetical protein NTW60_01385, partial [Candidatus Wolfebacteria bacterium]|nr:hypothetical protein [Candidatus Wolfebacteria bacterium]